MIENLKLLSFLQTTLGLLVEPNIFNYQKLLEVNRKAASINACYSMSRLPTLVDFVNAHAVSGIRGSHMTLDFYF